MYFDTDILLKYSDPKKKKKKIQKKKNPGVPEPQT